MDEEIRRDLEDASSDTSVVELSLADALASAFTGAQLVEGDHVHNVFNPNRFNRRRYWFVSGLRGQEPTKKEHHRLMSGIITLVRWHGLDVSRGWHPLD